MPDYQASFNRLYYAHKNVTSRYPNVAIPPGELTLEQYHDYLRRNAIRLMEPLDDDHDFSEDARFLVVTHFDRDVVNVTQMHERIEEIEGKEEWLLGEVGGHPFLVTRVFALAARFDYLDPYGDI